MIKTIEGINSFNKQDHGIDDEISKIIAEKTGICLHQIKLRGSLEKDKYMQYVLHGTSVLRDASRSSLWHELFCKKYRVCDLSIGGYGGEVLRAKYNIYANIKQYVKYYYKGNEAEAVCKFRDYQKNILDELRQYPVPADMNQDLLQNWYYAVTKMRIWGSGFIQMASLYGDIVHPFMDWYLLNPIFGFRLEQLKDAKMQTEFIQLFLPVLKDIPINHHARGGVKDDLLDFPKKFCLTNQWFLHVCLPFYWFFRNRKEYERMENRDELAAWTNELEIDRMLSKSGSRIRSRTKTILLAYRYARAKIDTLE